MLICVVIATVDFVILLNQLFQKITQLKGGKVRTRNEAEEINRIKYMVCCPMCDNEKCVRKTDKCEAEIWAKEKAESEDKE